jgi:hypothetical protein
MYLSASTNNYQHMANLVSFILNFPGPWQIILKQISASCNFIHKLCSMCHLRMLLKIRTGDMAQLVVSTWQVQGPEFKTPVLPKNNYAWRYNAIHYNGRYMSLDFCQKTECTMPKNELLYKLYIWNNDLFM